MVLFLYVSLVPSTAAQQMYMDWWKEGRQAGKKEQRKEEGREGKREERRKHFIFKTILILYIEKTDSEKCKTCPDSHS